MSYSSVVLSAFGGKLKSEPIVITSEELHRGYRVVLRVSSNPSYAPWGALDGASLPIAAPTYTAAIFHRGYKQDEKGNYIMELDPSVFRPVEVKVKTKIEIVEERISLWKHIKRSVREVMKQVLPTSSSEWWN